MKRLFKLAPCLLLAALTMMSSAFAAEVPDTIVTENLNGQQRLVKTYTLSPDADPDELREDDFTYDGFCYSWAYTTKEEQVYQDTKSVTETVTVETSSDDLSEILAALDPSIPYDQDGYTGVLTLDHTTLSTVAAGYTTKYSTVTETKVIGNLDRNDMSYVPATTTKNGKMLSLSNVEWQVTGTDLVGEALMPSRYQAVATYSGSSSYKVATGYVTTADYCGEVTAEGIDSITYTVVYTGSEVTPAPAGLAALFGGQDGSILPLLFFGLLLLLLAGLTALGICLFRRRKNVYVYIPGDSPHDYKLVAKYRVAPEVPEIGIQDADIGTADYAAVEIKRSLVKKLFGKTFTVHHPHGQHCYQIVQNTRSDWHEFALKEEVEASCDSEEPEVSAE